MNKNKRHRLLCILACVAVGIVLVATPAQSLDHGSRFFLGNSELVQSAKTIEITVILALAAILIARILGKPASDQPAGEAGLAGAPATGRREKLAEEEDFEKFVSELRAGPVPAPQVLPRATGSPLSRVHAGRISADTEVEPESRHHQLGEFVAWAEEHVGMMHKLIEKSRQTESQTARRDILVEICDQIGVIKYRVCRPESRPAWQLTTAMEGLLKQLTSRAGNINHSTLRTIAGGLELLGDLCKPGVRTDLASNPAIRILAADDDSVSRYALGAAVKKAFDQPDLAESGKEALAQVRQHRYDLIILDVMMPDMDGFEVCGKIRESAPNRSTPVLFVTSLKDFDSRTKSLSSGGSDLMGKPYLTFEIAVKALTLVLRARLNDRNRVGEVSGAPSVRWPESRSTPEAEEPADPPAELLEDLNRTVGNPGANPTAILPPSPFVEAVVAGKDLRETPGKVPPEFAPAFLMYMEVFLREMKHDITLTGGMEADAARQEMLVRLHMRLQSLSRKINLPELRPAFQMCCAVEGLCKKLKNDPKKVTASALRTAATGLELLGDLCAPGVRSDLAEAPPIRMLVVDDEPLARRALLGALQMAFPRPDGAESAESALVIAGEKEFDLIFLDVCMPEMDGFTACTKIHETAANRATPVVFVTSHSDEDLRAEADWRGARDFVVKPFDFLEIPVKALTYALQARLEKLKTRQSPDAPTSAKLNE